jgi:hypothetical protein
MHRKYTWLLPSLVAIVLACAGPAETPAPEPTPDPGPEPTPAPAGGTWALDGLTLTFDPSLQVTPGEVAGEPDLNMKVLGEGTLTGGAEVEVRTWKPPFQDAPRDDPFGQTAEEAKQAAGAYVRACRDGAVDQLIKQTKDPAVGTMDELATRGMMWDAADYSVMVHHLWTFRNPADLCAVAWVASEGQEIFFGPKLRVAVGRGDERFVVIVEKDLKGSPIFAPLEGKSVKEQFQGAGPLAKTVWDSPEVADVRKFVDTMAKK